MGWYAAFGRTMRGNDEDVCGQLCERGLRAFSIHMLPWKICARWLFLKEKPLGCVVSVNIRIEDVVGMLFDGVP
jgi:hypothetical protein